MKNEYRIDRQRHLFMCFRRF
jgi:hypothetical protein